MKKCKIIFFVYNEFLVTVFVGIYDRYLEVTATKKAAITITRYSLLSEKRLLLVTVTCYSQSNGVTNDVMVTSNDQR